MRESERLGVDDARWERDALIVRVWLGDADRREGVTLGLRDALGERVGLGVSERLLDGVLLGVIVALSVDRWLAVTERLRVDAWL